MLAMSNPNVNPGSIETQQMQIKAPVGVRFSSPIPLEKFVSVLMVFLPTRHTVPGSTEVTSLVSYQRTTNPGSSRFLRIPSEPYDRWPVINDTQDSNIEPRYPSVACSLLPTCCIADYQILWYINAFSHFSSKAERERKVYILVQKL